MRFPRLRHLTAIVAAAAGVAALPAAAHAATTFTPCAGQPSFECATVDVPLDWSGQVPGTVPLHVERQVGTGGRSVAWIGLAGGPGQAANALAESDWLGLAQPVAKTDQIVTFDQRGTGQSGLIDCTKPFAKARTDLQATALCGDSLGATRPFYTTSASVQDIEAVRQAVGADKVVLLGVSYGTYVAERYARAYPDRVAALVLDSTVPLTGVQQWNAETYAAVPRILATLCADDGCPFTRSSVADLSSVTRKLDSAPRGGTFVSASGRVSQQRLGSATDLVDLLLAGDFSPQARAFLPGALAAARAGDWTPLVRLVGLVSESGDEGAHSTADEAAESSGLFLATTCTDTALPWAPASPVSGRSGALTAAASALPASAFAPFDRQTALAMSLGTQCLSWPSTNAAPYADPGTPVAVPTLILSGSSDLRTPTSNAQQAQTTFPNSTLVQVAGVGHYVLGNDQSGCSFTAYTRFLSGTAIGTPCANVNENPVTEPRPPTSLGNVPTLGASGTPGRLARVAARTMVDALESAELTTPVHNRTRLGGLRGGRVAVALTGSSETATLTQDQYLSGVRVSGTVRLTSSTLRATLRVDGGSAARRGTITIDGGAVSGTIGGRRITVSAAASATAARVGARDTGPLAGLGSLRFRGPGVDIG